MFLTLFVTAHPTKQIYVKKLNNKYFLQLIDIDKKGISPTLTIVKNKK